MILIAGGWVLAYFARRGVAAVVLRVNTQSVRWGSRARPALSEAFGRALQQIVYWGIVLVFILLGLSHVGGNPLSAPLDRLWMLASHVLIALAILAISHILGSLARGLLNGFSRKTGLIALPRMAYGLIVGVGLVTALSHLGLNVTFITQMVLIVTGVFFAGLAFAFAGGARTLVANLAANEELNRYKPGDQLVVEDIEGTVIEIHRTGMVLTTSRGLVRIPASKFAESAILLVNQGDGDG
jgi:hypothetical protein